MRVELLSWDEARAHAAPIRFAVFVEEQGVPADIELDEHDAVCVHAVAFDGERAVGTGRLLPDGHIGRMAVLQASRNRGVGALLLVRLMERAKELGFPEVALSAQIHAARFYRRHGFVEEGPEYMEAGIRHQAMRRAL
ncbi:MAG: GNAT family N-acetyltransferase [Betaproteobacteria bacterium]